VELYIKVGDFCQVLISIFNRKYDGLSFMSKSGSIEMSVEVTIPSERRSFGK
jgi:hypothetical protein